MGKMPILATCSGDPADFWQKIKDRLPSAKWELVTPEMAHKYLERNKDNRKLRSSTVAFYATAMAQNQWFITHQPLAFDDGDIGIDGQHRLEAVIKYGKPVLFLVVRGVPSATKQVCDQMLKRQGDDALRWAGETYKGSGPSSIIRRMAMGLAWDYKISVPDLIELSKRYHKHVQFAMDCFPSNEAHVTTASVKAVFARAHYNKVAQDRLKEFADLLYTGETTSAPLVRLRDWLRNNPGVRASISMREVYSKCEQALDLWVNDRTLTGQLRGTTAELYPIPWDTAMQEKKDQEEAIMEEGS